MRLEVKCCCGATALFEDHHASYVQTGGKPDEKGRVFQIEVMHDKWQEAHYHHASMLVGEAGGKP